MKIPTPTPDQSEWRHLSALFPQIERIEGSREQALKALALRMDENKAMWFRPGLRVRSKDFGAKIGSADGVFWSNFKIDPENSSASGPVRFYRLSGRRNPLFGEIEVEGILLLVSEVDRLWPPGRKRQDSIKSVAVSHRELLAYLNQHANGRTTEKKLLAAAREHFHPRKIPNGSRWRPTFANLDQTKKRQPGRPEKYDNV